MKLHKSGDTVPQVTNSGLHVRAIPLDFCSDSSRGSVRCWI